ncbi:predicted GPI-anchored protein 58 [Empidonax traillii]|uniref:predicted GPI-anchored protein 58 n=1 Tax=Empidonax traillii TaxID=164674 RepID=UPI000FFD2328|nr:predicted GPI-anchored protein 58 [Empidonax traillii]
MPTFDPLKLDGYIIQWTPCRRPPVTAAGGTQSRPGPRNNCCNFPRSPTPHSSLRSPPRPAPLRSPRLTGSAAVAAACCAPLLRDTAGLAQSGPTRPVGRGALRCGAVQHSTARSGPVRYGATGRSTPLPAALIPALGCHSAPLTAPTANGKARGRRAPPRAVAPAREEPPPNPRRRRVRVPLREGGSTPSV